MEKSVKEKNGQMEKMLKQKNQLNGKIKMVKWKNQLKMVKEKIS